MESVDSLGEGNAGTGESGARIASTEAVVNRDDDMAVGLGRWPTSALPLSVHSRPGPGFATRS